MSPKHSLDLTSSFLSAYPMHISLKSGHLISCVPLPSVLGIGISGSNNFLKMFVAQFSSIILVSMESFVILLV
jgi:hypothetical protein